MSLHTTLLLLLLCCHQPLHTVLLLLLRLTSIDRPCLCCCCCCCYRPDHTVLVCCYVNRHYHLLPTVHVYCLQAARLSCQHVQVPERLHTTQQ
jgi:hypothetical protein